MMRTVGIVIAILFSLFYIGLYPMLTGRSVIYWYPYWSPALAAAYVAGGILLQAWFCYNRGASIRRRTVVAQVLTGLGYLALTVLVSDGPYMS
jgi:hypothetical protein